MTHIDKILRVMMVELKHTFFRWGIGFMLKYGLERPIIT